MGSIVGYRKRNDVDGSWAVAESSNALNEFGKECWSEERTKKDKFVFSADSGST